MRLLTRQEILDQWQTNEYELLNAFCCPICKEILCNYKHTGHIQARDKYGDTYYCHNEKCNRYNKPIKQFFNVGKL